MNWFRKWKRPPHNAPPSALMESLEPFVEMARDRARRRGLDEDDTRTYVHEFRRALLLGRRMGPADIVAMATVFEFRKARAKAKRLGELKVEILPRSEWQPDWIGERRLGFSFAPKHYVDSTGRKHLQDSYRPILSCFAIVFRDGAQVSADYVSSPSLYQRGELAQFEGSVLAISESSEAFELKGGRFTPDTTLSARLQLARATFRFVWDLVERRGDAVLVFGVPEESAKPSRRPVEIGERLPPGFAFEAEAPRLWIALARIKDRTLEPIEEWMAIERA